MTFSTEDEIPSHLQAPSILHSSIWKANAPYCHSLLICLQSSAHLMLGLLSMTDVLYRHKRVCVFAEFVNFFFDSVLLKICFSRFLFHRWSKHLSVDCPWITFWQIPSTHCELLYRHWEIHDPWWDLCQANCWRLQTKVILYIHLHHFILLIRCYRNTWGPGSLILRGWQWMILTWEGHCLKCSIIEVIW